MDKKPVLIVDDDTSVSEMLAELLTHEGYNTLIANNGAEALSIMKKLTPAATLIDLKLPDMDGLTLMREVKKLSPELEFIVVTGNASKESAIEAVNLGAFSYIQKPYDPEQMLITLQRAIEKSKAEATIRKQRNFVQRVFESITHPMYVVDANNYRVVMANKAALKGADRDDPTCYALMHGLDAPCAGEHVCPLKEIKRTKKEVTLEHVHLDSEGKEISVEIHGFPITDKTGEVVQMIEYAIDISDRKKAAAKTREWKNRYEAAVMASGQILYDWNSTTDEVAYGGGLNEILGYSINEIPGGLKDWIDLIHPDDRDRIERTIAELAKTKDSAHLEYRVRKKSGDYIYVEDNGYFIKDAGGNTTRMVGFVKDITERKKNQEELTNRMNELEEFNRLSVDRELKMIELKKEVNQLLAEHGGKKKYIDT